MLYADKNNLDVLISGQSLILFVDNQPAIAIDLTNTDFISLINEAYDTYTAWREAR